LLQDQLCRICQNKYIKRQRAALVTIPISIDW
jgi:hypothetical protein